MKVEKTLQESRVSRDNLVKSSLHSSKSFQNLRKLAKQRDKLEGQKMVAKFNPSKDVFFDNKAINAWTIESSEVNKKNKKKGKKKFKNVESKARKFQFLKRSNTTQNISSKKTPRRMGSKNVNKRQQNIKGKIFSQSQNLKIGAQKKNKNSLTPKFNSKNNRSKNSKKIKSIVGLNNNSSKVSLNMSPNNEVQFRKVRTSLNMKGTIMRKSQTPSVISMKSGEDLAVIRAPIRSGKKQKPKDSNLPSSQHSSKRKIRNQIYEICKPEVLNF